MNVLDCEKAAICIALKYPETDNDIVSQMFSLVGDDKLGNDNTIAHQVIWAALAELIFSQKLTTIDNLMIHLQKTDSLDTVGGEVYLRSLYGFLSNIGVNTNKNWRQYIDIINIAGTLRQFGKLIEEYSTLYQDFDKLVASTEDPEEFIFSFTNRIEKLFDSNLSNEGYNHIAVAVEKELEILDDINKGQKDVLITGMPSLEAFAIPYPRSLGIIIGMRSMGKTQLGLQIILGKARHIQLLGIAGECTINSLETPSNLLVRRLACCEARIDSRKLRLNELTVEELERYKLQLEDIQTLPIAYDDSPTLTSDQLTQRAIGRHLRIKRVLGMSDYAELFTDNQRGANEEQRISTIVKNVKKIAWSTGSCEILISQVNSAAKLNKFMIAGIDNARYSAVFAHASDWAIELVNYPQLIKANFKPVIPDGMSADYAWGLLEKNRNGPLGKIAFRWTAEYTRLVDTAIQASPHEMNKLYDFKNDDALSNITEQNWY